MSKLPKPRRLRSLPTKARAKPKTSRSSAASTRPSSILGHQYNPETGQLTVNFLHGGSYHYEGISQTLADEFKDAESKGKFLHSHIIGKHDTSKI